MSFHWAFIFHAPGKDPERDRTVVEGGGFRAVLVPVTDVEAAETVAPGLIDDGAKLIELCGAFGVAGAARVVKAVDGRAAVGNVTFPMESGRALARLHQD